MAFMGTVITEKLQWRKLWTHSGAVLSSQETSGKSLAAMSLDLLLYGLGQS